MSRYIALLCFVLASVVSCDADATRQGTPNSIITSASATSTKIPNTSATTPTHTPTSSVAPTKAATTTLAPTTATTTLAPATTTLAPTTTTKAPTTTTPAPTTTNATTHTSPTPSNATTDSPTTSNATTSNATTAPPSTTTRTTPTPTPTPALPTPTTGKFVIKPPNGTEGCLLADFGLRVGYEYKGKSELRNFNSTNISISGKCEVNSSDLHLVSDSMSFIFTFTRDAKKFSLHALNITVHTDSGESIPGASNNLSVWEASVGSSYMCNKEQNFTINGKITLFTFNLRVQPFGVKKGVFSTAHECSLDDTSVLIPIIVGAALAVLIVIVVIAYMIGRRKTYVGYQTL